MPLFLVVGAILGSSFFITHYWTDSTLIEFLRIFMGLFFLTFGSFKLFNLREFAETYKTYDIIARQVPSYGYIYPYIELALGLGYLIDFSPIIINCLTFMIMTIGSLGIAKELVKGNKIRCACLGAVVKLPLTTVSLIEDSAMAIMALGMLWYDLL